MAKSIGLGGETFLDASAVYGRKGTITSSADLNNFRYARNTGMYYLLGSPANAPITGTMYGVMFVLGVGDDTTSFAMQIVFLQTRIYTRRCVGSPATWETWRSVALA